MLDNYTHNAYNKIRYRMTVKEIEKILKADGWYFVTAKGSHNQYKHAVKLGKVTVPNHRGDIPIGTIKAILKQAGLKEG